MGVRQRVSLHRENINGLRNQATALKMKAAATSSSLSGKRPYRFSAALHTPRRLRRVNAKLTCRMAALQGKSFAPLITLRPCAIHFDFGRFAKIRFSRVEL
jgi:hypothetical protein